jgi:transposase
MKKKTQDARKKYVVRLKAPERERLRAMVSAGKAAAYKVRHANILLAVDESRGGAGLTDERAAKALSVSVRAIEQLRRRLVEQGLEACLERKKQDRPSVEPKFDGEQEARLIALACSKAPDGRERWSLRLLADRAVELKIVDSTSHETVRQVLSKTRSSRT